MNEEELRKQLKQEIKQELKKERRKRRIIILVVLAIIILGFVGYIYISNNNNSITQEEFIQYKEEIIITKDNWKDYIIAEDITEEITNEFGEVLRTNKNTVLKLKENICGYVIIEIKEKSTTHTEIITLTGGNTNHTSIATDYLSKHIGEKQIYDNTTTIDNIECIQIKGYIYKLNIPDNLWKTNRNTGNQYIKILDNYGNFWLTLIKQENYIYSLSLEEYLEREH